MSITTRTMVSRQLDYWVRVYLRTWKGSAISAFLAPVFYLTAMGLLLGRYVDERNAEVGGAASYLEFVAPGLLAATAMQVAVGEVLWPVMGAIKWDKHYYAMLATPLRIRDVVVGHLSFASVRIAVSSTVFVIVLAAFGLLGSVTGAVGALAAAILTGVAFATPLYGFAAGTENEAGFALVYRVGVIPLFLFSGAFFPISNLAEPLEWLARLTPLWHGVELCRMSALGSWAPIAVLHVVYLAALAAVGVWWSVRRLDRRMVV